MQHRLVAGQRGLGDGRQVGQQRRARRAGDGERAHLALLDQRDRGRQRGEIDRDVPADQVGQRRRRTLVGNVGQLHARHRGEQFGAEMDAAADARGRIIQLAGIALGERDQLGDRFRRNGGVHQHDQRAGRDQADRREILARVVADIRIERRIDRVRAGAAEAERVAVGRGLRDLARRDRAARAALVLDHDLLAERLAHLLGDDARHHVVAAAGRIRDDQRDRPRRIVLRGGARRCEQGEAESGNKILHATSSQARIADLRSIAKRNRRLSGRRSIFEKHDTDSAAAPRGRSSPPCRRAN